MQVHVFVAYLEYVSLLRGLALNDEVDVCVL
jgi:hypothetical protein